MTDPELTARAHQMMPFSEVLGLAIVSGGADRVEAQAEWAADRCTVGGILHGGYLMALADSVGGICAGFNLPEGARTATIEAKTNFINGAGEGSELSIVSEPVHVGGMTIVVQTDITRPEVRLITRTIQTQAVMR